MYYCKNHKKSILQKVRAKKKMSRYREPSEPHYVSFEELETIERLLKTKKLTDKQKEAIESLLKQYYSAVN